MQLHLDNKNKQVLQGQREKGKGHKLQRSGSHHYSVVSTPSLPIMCNFPDHA